MSFLETFKIMCMNRSYPHVIPDWEDGEATATRHPESPAPHPDLKLCMINLDLYRGGGVHKQVARM